ncbi:MAG: bifunctional folylpolyglutamate synthase/dihydrofolate synthase, partial [Flavobacteriaceae bacterium]|nr:bifunctional folylpolyglutamate synthase/dihydrofolate synthase [Flavobacteriaceae bacterium]
MTYQETLDWMFGQLPMYQRVGKTAFKKDLTNSLAFSQVLGNPSQKFKSIHVGGTNGKGSTSHMLASILQEARYKVGLYTSPHLKNFTERIRINGQEISRTYVVDFIAKHKRFLEHQKLSFFEMTVGLAFDYFASQQVDIAIIEVGMGGKLDSTNIITPEVSVITNIGYDHMQFLGETLPEIAIEKGGIIKENIPLVIGEHQDEVAPIFIDKAKELHAPISFASHQETNYQTDLLGDYQIANVKTAIEAIAQLKNFKVSQAHISSGLLHVVKNTNLKGRWQILNSSPKIICDTAHNAEGLQIVMHQLKKETYQQLHIVLGMVADKKLADILPLFPKEAIYYFCKPNIPRGLVADLLQEEAKVFALQGERYASVAEALQQAKLNATEHDV